jgi:hypothetical protein
VLGGHQTRINLDAAGHYRKVVKTSTELNSAHLGDADAPALGAIVDRKLLEQDDAVHHRMELLIAMRRREVIEQQNGAVAACKVVLQR